MQFGLVQYMDMHHFQNALSSCPYHFPLILVSESGAKRWGIDSLLLEKHQTSVGIWFSQIDSNPTQYTVLRGLEAIRGRKIDGIIAIGGGSAVDLAKQISAFHTVKIEKAHDVLRVVQEKSYLENRTNILPITAVPTTAGTGSEVTQWATLWDRDTGKKYSVDAPWLLPEKVWMVPELTISLPARMTLAAGLDAVCQAVESYWSKASNPFSRALSVRAIELITQNLALALSDPHNLKLRENLCTGSLVAGLAFSQTRTTACHSLSYPLTAQFGIEHGLAAAISLAQIAEINKALVDISELEALFAPCGGIQGWVDSVCNGILILRLSAFGVTEADFDTIVENAFTGGRMDNNPMELSRDMVFEILKTIL